MGISRGCFGCQNTCLDRNVFNFVAFLRENLKHPLNFAKKIKTSPFEKSLAMPLVGIFTYFLDEKSIVSLPQIRTEQNLHFL